MEYPRDGVMLLLSALRTSGGGCLDTEDGVLTLRLQFGEPVAITALADALDDLEARGWIAIDESGARVTEAGHYWHAKWLVSRHGRRAKGLELSMTATQISRVA